MSKFILKLLGLINAVLISSYVYAEPAEVVSQSAGMSKGMGSESWVTAFLGLGVVVTLIFGLAWFVKRFSGLNGTGKSHIKVLTVLPVGARERVALIEVAGEQLLIGITAQNINLLKNFEGIVVRPPDAPSDFASRLQSLLRSPKRDASSADQDINS